MKRHLWISTAFVLVTALSALKVAGQELRAAASTPPSIISISVPRPQPTPISLELKLIGTYRPDGQLVKASERGRMPDISWRRELRPAEVPPSVNLHPREGIVQDYAPPKRASRLAKNQSLFGSLRDNFLTFIYGREAILKTPTHVATDSKQRLIISDPGQCAVHILNGTNSFRIAGGPQSRLRHPVAVAVDNADNIYVTDAIRGLVLVYDPYGRFLRSLGDVGGESLFQGPTGIAIDRRAGRLYVVDSPANQLVVLDLEGKILHRIGSRRMSTSGVQFDQPTEVAVSGNAVAVLDSFASRIQVLSALGDLLHQFEIRQVTDDSVPRMGLAMDGAGNIYVSNLGSSALRIYTQRGERIGALARSDSSNKQLGAFTGLGIDSSDRIYAADAANGRIDIFGPAEH